MSGQPGVTIPHCQPVPSPLRKSGAPSSSDQSLEQHLTVQSCPLGRFLSFHRHMRLPNGGHGSSTDFLACPLWGKTWRFIQLLSGFWKTRLLDFSQPKIWSSPHPGPLAVPLQFEVGGLLKTSVDRLPPDLALELQGFPHFDRKPRACCSCLVSSHFKAVAVESCIREDKRIGTFQCLKILISSECRLPTANSGAQHASFLSPKA